MNTHVHVFFHTKFFEKLPPQEFCNVTCLKRVSQAAGLNLLKALPQQVHLTVTLWSRFYTEVWEVATLAVTYQSHCNIHDLILLLKISVVSHTVAVQQCFHCMEPELHLQQLVCLVHQDSDAQEYHCSCDTLGYPHSF
jgi:hypothetical protein